MSEPAGKGANDLSNGVKSVEGLAGNGTVHPYGCSGWDLSVGTAQGESSRAFGQGVFLQRGM